jgi:hypothetical protein
MDVTLKVLDVKSNAIKIQVLNHIITIPFKWIRSVISRDEDDPVDLVVRNAVLRLRLSKVNIDSKADLIAALNNVTFKMMGD